MEDCPSLPGLQVVFKQRNDLAPPPLQTTQRRPWQQRPQAPQVAMPPQYPSYNAYPQQWNTPMPWKNMNVQNPPWQQGWRGYSQGNVPPQYPQYPPQYPQNQGNFSHPPMPQL